MERPEEMTGGNLWHATACPRPSGLQQPTGNLKADIIVIGGGFLGLSTALQLSKDNVRVTVLEANEIGWGASGRNGGQVIAGLKYDPQELEKRYPEQAEALIQLSGSAPSVVFDIVQKYGIECDAFTGGWLQPAHSAKALDLIANRQRQWKAHGVETQVLGQQETARRLGTSAYHGAWYDSRGGNIQPLSYCYGLGQAALNMGCQIIERAKVERLQRNGSLWEAMLSSGQRFVADHIVICTNGYSDNLIPKLRNSLIAANSHQIATYPLPKATSQTILPGGISASDTRNLLLYFRKDVHGRFIIGGRGPFNATGQRHEFNAIVAAAHRLYPQLLAEKFQFYWSGRVALTRDFLPHLHNPSPGLYILVGFNGRGVAMTSAMGRELAAVVQRHKAAASAPFYQPQVKSIPFPWLKKTYIQSAVVYYRLRDRLS